MFGLRPNAERRRRPKIERVDFPPTKEMDFQFSAVGDGMDMTLRCELLWCGMTDYSGKQRKKGLDLTLAPESSDISYVS